MGVLWVRGCGNRCRKGDNRWEERHLRMGTSRQGMDLNYHLRRCARPSDRICGSRGAMMDDRYNCNSVIYGRFRDLLRTLKRC